MVRVVTPPERRAEAVAIDAASTTGPVPRRRRVRDPRHAPGQVRHIVFERTDSPGPGDDPPPVDGRVVWAPRYPQLRQALDAVAVILDQARQLRRCADELDALLASVEASAGRD